MIQQFNDDESDEDTRKCCQLGQVCRTIGSLPFECMLVIRACIVKDDLVQGVLIVPKISLFS